MGRRTRAFIVALAIAAGWFAPVLPVMADGIASFPIRLTLEDALRGADYERRIAFVNDFAFDTAFTFETTGAAGEWVTVTDDDGNPLDSAPAPSGQRVDLMALIQIPPGTPNGTYEGTVGALLQTSDEVTVGGAGVSLGVVIPIVIDVTGEQIVQGAFPELIVPSSGEVGLPLRIVARVLNSGNVVVQPEVVFEFSDDTGAIVATETPELPPVAPSESADLEYIWDTAEQRAGDYVVSARITFKDLDLGVQQGAFSLAPRGTLTRSGTILDLRLVDDQLEPGDVAKFEADFQNTGVIEARAVLEAEVTRNGERIDAFQTAENLVLAGQADTIEFFVDIPEAGSYAVVATVNFEGTRSDPARLEFEVARAGGSGIGWWLGFGLLLVLLGGGGAALWSVRKRRAEA